jgi:hypothetical protein
LTDFFLPERLDILNRDASQLVKILNKHGHGLIIGPWGTGKTTLINYFWIAHRNDYEFGYLLNGYELRKADDLVKIIKEISDGKQSLLIIDGYERIQSETVRELLMDFYKKSKKYKIDILISGMSIADARDEDQQGDIFHMQTLADTDANKMITQMLQSSDLRYEDIDRLLLADPSLKYSLLSIDKLKNLLIMHKDFRKDILDPLQSGINYESDLISIAGNRKIIEPAQKKIITEIKLTEKDLIRLVKGKPESIFKLTTREFEEMVAELYRRNGYEVVLTKETRDGGKDFIISNKSLLGNQLIYGECKRHRPENPVSISILRELHSTIITDNATGGILVTSSYFSPDAKKFAENIKHQMNLVDFVALNKMIIDVQADGL